MGRNHNEPPAALPTTHTAILRDPIDMWYKLVWDADQFRDIQVDHPEEQQPLAYAAINVCIAARSLRDWVEQIHVRNVRRVKRKPKPKPDLVLFRADLFAAIPEQAVCEAIANTAKHSRFNEADWPGGRVDLYWMDADEDLPGSYVLFYSDDHGKDGAFALNRFSSLVDNWWNYLSANALAIGANRTPTWQQNKLNRLFRNPDPASARTD